MFLRELFSEATYREWKDRLGTDIQAVERVMNHVHVYDLFLNPKLREADARVARYFAEVLGKLWSLRAAEEFGAGRIVVDLLDEEPPGTDPVLILCQDTR